MFNYGPCPDPCPFHALHGMLVCPRLLVHLEQLCLQSQYSQVVLDQKPLHALPCAHCLSLHALLSQQHTFSDGGQE